MTPTPVLIRETEVADIIGLSVRTVRAWRSQGEGPPFFHVGRSVRYNREHVIEWIDERTITRPQATLSAADKGRLDAEAMAAAS